MKVVSTSAHSSVGLFWFSKDYSSIIKVAGECEVTHTDIRLNTRIDPVGLHAEFDMPRDTPRGRISLVDGKFIIWVGEDCNVDPTDMVKSAFSLKNLDNSFFKVKKHFHWNTKEGFNPNSPSQVEALMDEYSKL